MLALLQKAPSPPQSYERLDSLEVSKGGINKSSFDRFTNQHQHPSEDFLKIGSLRTSKEQMNEKCSVSEAIRMSEDGDYGKLVGSILLQEETISYSHIELRMEDYYLLNCSKVPHNLLSNGVPNSQF